MNNIKQINCIGDTCPLPVIKAKQALKIDNQVEVLVDNLIATQNLTKLAEQFGMTASLTREDEQKYHVLITKGDNFSEGKTTGLDEVITETNQKKTGSYIVVCSSDKMGEGDPALSKILIKSFLYALIEQDILPKKIFLYNKGIYLGLKESETLADLELLAQAGVEIMSCGLCTDYYGVTADIGIGNVTNMYSILENMRQYPVVKPS